MREPFYVKSRKKWYVWFGGKQTSLGADKDAAFDAWHKMQIANDSGPDPVCIVILEAFSKWAVSNYVKTTVDWYDYYLKDFIKFGGLLRVSEVTATLVTEWLDKHPAWGDSSRRAGITALKKAFNWASGDEEKRIPLNPIAKMPRPSIPFRDTLVSGVDHRTLREAAIPQFRLYLTALRHSGCRPGEVAKVTAKQYHPKSGFWLFGLAHKTARKTKKTKIVPLTPCLDTISRILSQVHRSGPMFHNSDGNPWNKSSVASQFRRLRKRLNLDEKAFAYAYRHTFATEGLVNGMDVTEVAAALGHTDTRMLMERYAHLTKKAAHLRAAVAKGVTIERNSAEDPHPRSGSE